MFAKRGELGRVFEYLMFISSHSWIQSIGLFCRENLGYSNVNSGGKGEGVTVPALKAYGGWWNIASLTLERWS